MSDAQAQSQARSQTPPRGSRFASDGLTWLALFAVGFVVYWLTGSRPQQIDAFAPLARAFLEGHLYITLPDKGALELVARPEGGWYVPYPPGPALTVLPFVPLFDLFNWQWDIGLFGALYGGLAVALLNAALRQMGVSWSTALWLAVAFAFGSVWWWTAGVADVWLYGHISAVLFALLALNLALRDRWPLIGGLCLGLAMASRLPVGLTVPLYLALYGRVLLRTGSGTGIWATLTGWLTGWRSWHWRRTFVFLVGFGFIGILLAIYNQLRFGSPIDFGYTRIAGVLQEPWFAQGILSISYIPRHIYAIFFQSFNFVDQWPFLQPNWMGLSLVISTPIFLWLVRARAWVPLIVFGWLSVALGLIPVITHGTVGQAQFGYRFSLDVAPILWLMLGWVFRERMPLEAKLAAIVGVIVNAYGLYAIIMLNFVNY